MGNNYTQNNIRNMGLMFLDTTANNTPAAFKRTLASVRDGTTSTILLTENINAGIGTDLFAFSWANPHPCNTSFFVNGVGAVGVGSSTKTDPYDYSQANNRGNQAPPLNTSGIGGTPPGNQGGINGSTSGLDEGRFPYPNSLHTGGVNVAMCDGSARFIADTISGAVWARLVTPNGGSVGRPDTGALTFGVDAGTGGWRELPLKDDQY
jgi:prepilin-type processing-associated H-X9-DG protein